MLPLHTSRQANKQGGSSHWAPGSLRLFASFCTFSILQKIISYTEFFLVVFVHVCRFDHCHHPTQAMMDQQSPLAKPTTTTPTPAATSATTVACSTKYVSPSHLKVPELLQSNSMSRFLPIYLLRLYKTHFNVLTEEHLFRKATKFGQNPWQLFS